MSLSVCYGLVTKQQCVTLAVYVCAGSCRCIMQCAVRLAMQYKSHLNAVTQPFVSRAHDDVIVIHSNDDDIIMHSCLSAYPLLLCALFC